MEEAGSMEEADLVMRIPVTTYRLTLDALLLSRSQVTLSCQCPCGYGHKSLHTYIQHVSIRAHGAATAVTERWNRTFSPRRLAPTTQSQQL
jgi:hypothetical protein